MSPLRGRRVTRAPAWRLSHSAVRARVSVGLLLAIVGMISGSWASRIPDVRARVAAGDAAWGLANTASTIGEFLSLGLILVIIGRANTRRLSVLGLSVLLIDAPLMAFASTLVGIVAGLFVMAFATQLVATPQKAQQLAVQGSYGRPLLGTFSACYTIGTFTGGSLGIVATAVGIAPGVQLAFSSAVLGVVLMIAQRWLPETPRQGKRRSDVPGSWFRSRLTPQLVLLIVLSFLTAYMVGARTQWCAIYVAQTLGGGSVLGATAYTVSSIANALALVVIDRLMARLGLIRLFRVSMLAAAAGLGLALAIPSPAVAVMGFLIVGVGAAAIDPTIYGAAGNQPVLTAGEATSVVEIGQPPAYLLSPALIGILASACGLRLALVTVVAALLAAAALANQISVTAGTIDR